MVMDLLGPSLEDLFIYAKQRFSLKTVLMIAEQTFQRVEFIHSKNLIHRDIKPDNFLVGGERRQHIIYMIDFGLSKRYRDARTGEHIPYRDGKELTGTARYASANTHAGMEQSRRDDLESLGYVWIYLLKGYLPWQGLKMKDKKAKYDAIKEKKINITVEDLCRGTPEEFSKYMGYCKKLKFDETPDYAYVRKLFKGLFDRMGFESDYLFDWFVQKKPIKKAAAGKSPERIPGSPLRKRMEDKRTNYAYPPR